MTSRLRPTLLMLLSISAVRCDPWAGSPPAVAPVFDDSRPAVELRGITILVPQRDDDGPFVISRVTEQLNIYTRVVNTPETPYDATLIFRITKTRPDGSPYQPERCRGDNLFCDSAVRIHVTAELQSDEGVIDRIVGEKDIDRKTLTGETGHDDEEYSLEARLASAILHSRNLQEFARRRVEARRQPPRPNKPGGS